MPLSPTVKALGFVSLLTGLLWQRWGAPTAFATGTVLAAAAALLLARVPEAAPARPV